MDLNDILTILSLIIAFLSVCVSLFSIQKARQTALTGTYFSEMTSAYAGFISAVNNFVYNHCDLRMRDELSSSLLRLQLYASPSIDQSAQKLYVQLLNWGGCPHDGTLNIDKTLQGLQDDMKSDLNTFRRKGDH